MEQIKSIIKGVLSGAVLFMAMQIGVAQEKELTANNKADVAEYVEAKVLAGTVQKLDAEWTKKRVELAAVAQEVMEPTDAKILPDALKKSIAEARADGTKAEAVKTTKNARFAQVWYALSVSGATWNVGEILDTPPDPSPEPGSGCRVNNPSGSYCAILLEFDPLDIDPEELENRTLASIQTEFPTEVDDIGTARSLP